MLQAPVSKSKHQHAMTSKLVPEVVTIIEENRTFYDASKSLNDLLSESEVCVQDRVFFHDIDVEF